MSGETVYVRGEGSMVRLTQVVAGELRDLEDYFGDLQESRMAELRCSETLADNLKIEVVRSTGSARRTVPFYIVEYDDVGDEFCVWRSDGKWGVGEEVVAAWCETLCQDETKRKRGSWRGCGAVATRVQEHPRRAVIESCLDRYHIDWSAVDTSVFWKVLERGSAPAPPTATATATAHSSASASAGADADAGGCNEKDDEEYGNLVLLALLNTELARNKNVVRTQLRRFCHRMARKAMQERKNSLESISEVETEDSSRLHSLSPSYTPASMSAADVDPTDVDPTDVPVHSDADADAPGAGSRSARGTSATIHSPRCMEEFEMDTSKQIMDNFNMLFKPIVENFEDVYLDKYSKHPRRSRNRVSK
ncbi:hypothetical protein RNJ44_00043 [Nakaseomyces bracarensis]|uniref:Uncharacterized protein n=1 Tax=Nakaseomyces bracarensis TaxID=273131 RepID=A0ABR4P0X5_9SACH